MSFFDSVADFAEGAWESVSTGAQNALGDWAGGSNAADTQSAQNTQPAQQTTAPVNAGFVVNQQTMLIGGGVLLVVLLLLRS